MLHSFKVDRLTFIEAEGRAHLMRLMWEQRPNSHQMFNFPNLYFYDFMFFVSERSDYFGFPTWSDTSTSVSDLRRGLRDWIEQDPGGAVWERMTQNSRQGHLIQRDWWGMWLIALQGAGWLLCSRFPDWLPHSHGHNRQRQGARRSSGVLFEEAAGGLSSHAGAIDFDVESAARGETQRCNPLVRWRHRDGAEKRSSDMVEFIEGTRRISRCMFRQEEMHLREFPDIHRLQTLVMRDEFVQCVKNVKTDVWCRCSKGLVWWNLRQVNRGGGRLNIEIASFVFVNPV